MNKTLTASELKKAFSPTPAKANYKYGSLFRTKKWTTNGHWLLLTSKETTALQKIRESEKEIKLTKFIKEVKRLPAYPAKIQNDIVLHKENIYIQVKTVDNSERFNGHYLSLLTGVLPESVMYFKKYFPNKETSINLLTFYEGETLVGIIYPITKEALAKDE